MINRVILVGRVGKDPQVKEFVKGDSVRQMVFFPLATHEIITDKHSGAKSEYTEWHSIEMWDKNAENALKILKQGRVVYIEGKMKSESWFDKNNMKRYSTKIKATMFQVMSNLGTTPKNETHSSGSGGDYSFPDEEF
jgi:single-strand DNA-binding protein